MTHKPAYLITDGTLTLLLDSKAYNLTTDHPNYRKVLDALTAEQYDGIPDLIDTRSAVRQWLSSDPDFTLTNDRVNFRGTPYNGAITDKVLRMIDDGHSPAPIFNFLRRVEKNPSAAARNELLLFCVANGFLIDTLGRIIAYKSVGMDYFDGHSRTVFYKPAGLMTDAEKATYSQPVIGGREKNVTMQVVNGDMTVTMPRNAVDDNRDRTCSYGLHFASHEYASTFITHGHLLALAVSPEYVVSIPSDYNNQKGRACEVVPIAEIGDFSKLPAKEVYDANDLWAASGDEDEDGCSYCDDKPDNSAEIERKRAVIAQIESRMNTRGARIAQIESLGGFAEGLLDEQDEDEELVQDIEAEILDLE